MARHIARGDTEETATERQVREAIQRHLGEDDVVISGLRLHDNTYGDVEIDLIVLMPNAGVGIVEVKGGTITFADGAWHQTGKDGTKEIDPAAQARRGWHSFRRFVERQPAWSRGRSRGDWFLAFPQTHVPPDEDMGPEGRRETIIAEGEELEAAYRIWDVLNRPQDKPLPAPGWVNQILELLQGQGDGPLSVEQRVAQRLRDIEEMSASQTTLVKRWRRNRMIDVAGCAHRRWPRSRSGVVLCWNIGATRRAPSPQPCLASRDLAGMGSLLRFLRIRWPDDPSTRGH